MGRTILVSHRLPYTVSVQKESYTLEASVGGLATGLMPLLQADSVWLGWSGSNTQLPPDTARQLLQDFEERGCIPIPLGEADHHGFLAEMCNGVLWPLYHYQLDNLPVRFSGWDEYVRINRQVAESVAAVAEPGDSIWIHDYHFQLLPAMLREMNLGVTIGFFLHIPFPAYEIFRILPWRKEILKGLLGADLIGFHTQEYLDYFLHSAKQLLHLEGSESSVNLVDRNVGLDVFPLGVDTDELTRPFDGDTTLADSLHRLRSGNPDLKLLLSVDRLDYTKGLARKILAFEALLDAEPSLRGKLMMIQIAPVSRSDVPAYHQFRRQLDEHVGRINGKYSNPDYQPIFYLTRSFHPQEIYQIYKDVDVMVVTPVRDGMNLVAKEFIASRTDNDGVLILSELAGAASELHEAMMVNPYDIAQMASSFHIAVDMPIEERRARMISLRERVITFRTAHWAKGFLDRLESKTAIQHRHTFNSPRALAQAIVETGLRLQLTLDYDGTLFPIVKVPATAIPDQELRRILFELSRLCELHIVSGRPMRELKSWFAGLAIHLHAEHGAVNESQGARITPAETEALEQLAIDLQGIADRYPGTCLERKTLSCCFHYRNANAYQGLLASKEAKDLIAARFPAMQMLEGKKTVEARFPHLHKGIVIEDLLAHREACSIVAVGDDRTDEDMFRAIPDHGFSIVVGDHDSHARYRLRDSEDVRAMLVELTDGLRNQRVSQVHSRPEVLLNTVLGGRSEGANGPSLLRDKTKEKRLVRTPFERLSEAAGR